MSFLDKAKAKAEEMGLREKAEHLATQAKEKAGELADANRDKISGAVDKAGAKINEKTEGKYADTIDKAKAGVAKGVDKVAEGKPGAVAGADSGTVPGGEPAFEPDVADADPGTPEVMTDEGGPVTPEPQPPFGSSHPGQAYFADASEADGEGTKGSSSHSW